MMALDPADEMRAHADAAPLELGAWVQRAAVLLTEAAHELKALRAVAGQARANPPEAFGDMRLPLRPEGGER